MDIKLVTNNELMALYYDAVEMQDGKLIKKLWDEMSFRNREE
jgi:hypothetical protein